MAMHNDMGKEGEEMAVKWLEENGFTILHRNWTYGKLEIDIIAEKGDKLHIIEVKLRKTAYFGNPEESVTKKKFKRLQKATDEFLFRNPGHKWLQYDILAITLKRDADPDIFFLQDVYL